MHTKSLSTDGKLQETTESAIITTEIVKHRNSGRFQEITEYFQRKVTIPLNVPTPTTDATPIRSGLRKRKREEAPRQTEPEVLEKWVPEEKLELWEIRAYRDRLERDKNASQTRTRTGVNLREPQRLDPGAASEAQPRSVKLNYKAEMDEKYKQQQNSRSVLQAQKQPQQPSQIQAQTPPAPTIIRRVQNPDGTISIIRTTMAQPGTPGAPGARTMVPTVVNQNTPNQQNMIQPGTKKVFLSKDGKIIGAQLVHQPTQPNANSTNNTGKIAIPTVGGVQNPSATPTLMQTGPPANAIPSPQQQQQQTQQKVQIVRSSDGKIQVRGLLPGQQLVQMPDGKLQIFSQPTTVQQQQQPQQNQLQPVQQQVQQPQVQQVQQVQQPQQVQQQPQVYQSLHVKLFICHF